MGQFSMDRAITAGFRLIGREPLAFLVWAAVFLIIGVLPQIGVFALILPEWTRMVREISANAAQSTPPSSAAALAPMFRSQVAMLQLQPIAWLASIVSRAVLLGAIYRAVLYPQDRRFFYLQLSGRELWLGLVMLVLVVMVVLLALAVMVPTAVVLGVLGALARNSPALGLLIVPVMCVAVGVIVWVALRLSLATPMSFAQSGFRLYESWDLTRGQVGKLFGVGLAMLVITWIFEVVLMGVVVSVGLSLIGGLPSHDQLQAWFQHPHVDLARLSPWIAGASIAVTIFATLVLALFGAGWAEIYQELTAEPDAA
jgi:hypothetical protein